MTLPSKLGGGHHCIVQVLGWVVGEGPGSWGPLEVGGTWVCVLVPDWQGHRPPSRACREGPEGDPLPGPLPIPKKSQAALLKVSLSSDTGVLSRALLPPGQPRPLATPHRPRHTLCLVDQLLGGWSLVITVPVGAWVPAFPGWRATPAAASWSTRSAPLPAPCGGEGGR